MRPAAFLILVLMAGLADARMGAISPNSAVTVCMTNIDPRASTAALLRSEVMGSGIFAAIGVRVQWQHGRSHCPRQAMTVELAFDTPEFLRPGVLGYAVREENHIVIFEDRIEQMPRHSGEPAVLAHVLVHEIAHILEGVDRHSDRGMMKARWDGRDLTKMVQKPLEFTDVDIQLIHDGLRNGTQSGLQ